MCSSFIGDPEGEQMVQVAYDFACGLSKYILTRDPEAGQNIHITHDRCVYMRCDDAQKRDRRRGGERAA